MRGPAPWEATVLQSQVEAVVQEERKREVRPVICAKGHVFGEAVNRKRRQAGSGEEGEPGRTGGRGTGPGVGGGRLLARCRRLGLTVAFEGSVSKGEAGILPCWVRLGVTSSPGPDRTEDGEERGFGGFRFSSSAEYGRRLELSSKTGSIVAFLHSVSSLRVCPLVSQFLNPTRANDTHFPSRR